MAERCLNAIGKSNTSSITILDNGFIKKSLDFEKKTTKTLNKVLFNFYPKDTVSPLIRHETNALMLLEDFDIAPKVFSIYPTYFIMSNVGDKITKNTKFKNLNDRISYIINCLEKKNIRHNDFRNTFQNYTCLNGILYIIDFQLADVDSIRPSVQLKKKLKPRSWDDIGDLNWFKNQFK